MIRIHVCTPYRKKSIATRDKNTDYPNENAVNNRIGSINSGQFSVTFSADRTLSVFCSDGKFASQQ